MSLVIGTVLFATRPTTFLPAFGQPQITASVSMPPGTSLAQTDVYTQQFESYLHTLIGSGDKGIDKYQTTVGSSGGFASFVSSGADFYDQNDEIILSRYDFPLNTVDYEAKHEIRITFSPDLIAVMPEHSVMIMEKGEDTAIDYVIRVYVPGSEQFQNYRAACNQTLPSGGKDVVRKMGWL